MALAQPSSTVGVLQVAVNGYPKAALESWYSYAGGGFVAGKPAITFANP